MQPHQRLQRKQIPHQDAPALRDAPHHPLAPELFAATVVPQVTQGAVGAAVVDVEGHADPAEVAHEVEGGGGAEGAED
ncbi:hypothetical protein OPT61_g8912 [Boeremia exigua]|uniref:Uncharacterized protein n=1 Tax=Boeremia exigua TaxID=749465 RepID=A0ACC2HWY6_9PLEO|nr:hypothetical protein OPT61_g8912 [Boeremia exigua]